MKAEPVVDMTPLKPERKAQHEEYATRRGRTMLWLPVWTGTGL